MTRTFSELATAEVRGYLNQLTQPVPPSEYRDAMRLLGLSLGQVIARRLNPVASVLLICTNEDADFLARGVLDAFASAAMHSVALACFWNDRKTERSTRGPDLDTAPIVRRYMEPIHNVDVFVVVKSVISSACVVRTNIAELVYDKHPERIIVTSPVIHSGARDGLEAGFDLAITRKFEYVWFAQDDEKKQNGEVVPGIGGSVYELLGIGTAATKNQYTPELVRGRRDLLAASA